MGRILALFIVVLGLAGCHVSEPSSPLAFTPRARDTRPIGAVCISLGVEYPPRSIYFRAFKLERELELWARDQSGKMELIRTSAIAAASGGPGPKRREGDFQVPEGIYQVAVFNPNSRFHLSLGLDYPNKADRILAAGRPGGDIFIHGNRVSAGCLAMTDPVIDEIYKLASHARSPVPVHIFPCRMEGTTYASMRGQYPALCGFWDELAPVYSSFERSHVVPRVGITKRGIYVLRG